MNWIFLHSAAQFKEVFVNDHQNFKLSEAEEKVLAFWREKGVFEKSVLRRKGKKLFVFYEGPPTANGRPGIHHVLARSFKDVIPRYKTMRGFSVPRRGGWDTHGLPVEIEVEKQLGLKSKKDIEKFGIAEFNKKCKESVWKYKEEWERLTERMGFWLDLKHPYITYENNYIETLWWIIKEVWKKKLLYKGHRVAPWCPRCGTALSSHEMAQGYKEVTDQSIYAKFKAKKDQRIGQKFWIDDRTYILSWTTTPWTLPGNVALAVGKQMHYVRVADGKDGYILAKELLPQVIGGNAHITHEFRGSELIGLEYEPLFEVPTLAKNKNSYKVYPANFVTTEDGTGVVHTAVMYGEDDYELGREVGLPQHHTVDEQGKFTSEVAGLAGLFVKAQETEKKIFAHLEKHGTLFRAEPYTHEYPFCWRCDTPLLYYARTSWFVAMSKLRVQLLKNNKTINWTPKHLKDGRFGEWIKEVKDWNFSRERYWGTPLPIWECEKCKAQEVVGSIDELHARSGGAKNEYWVMRHGESETQLLRVIDSGQGKKEYHLTPLGVRQAEATARKLKREKFDLILSSDILRAKETAEVVAGILGLKVYFEPRLREIKLPSLSDCHSREYYTQYPTYEDRLLKRPPGGESLRDLRARMFDLIEDLEKKHKDKKILLIGHEYPIWMLSHAALGWNESQAIEAKKNNPDIDFIDTGEARPLPFKNIPRNETGLADLHRPYIDSVKFSCAKCKGEMRRIPEIADVWFDSGSMPFAQVHHPFSKEKLAYPADYISEAVDQTRGWFYTLLAVGTLLGKGAPYKNVISLGHLNDKFGNKMSKSKGNVVDPWMMIEKYGVDAVRWYFFTATPPGEPKNFDEAEIAKAYRKFHLILWNSLLFWKTYAAKNLQPKTSNPKPIHVLDKWILARLDETCERATKYFDRYEIREAALALEELTDDLSRWYIRRSRRRLQKPESKKDFDSASATLGFVLREAVKLVAPFTPFFAEVLWNELGNKDSVHLVDWPSFTRTTEGKKLVAAMKEVRRFASAGLAKRAEAGIKVRQPLATLIIPGARLDKALTAILADEVNVKEIRYDSQLKTEAMLDTTITPALKEEGVIRELVRMIQDLRHEAGCKPSDKITVTLDAAPVFTAMAKKNEPLLVREVGAKTVFYKRSGKAKAQMQTTVDGEPVWIGISP